MSGDGNADAVLVPYRNGKASVDITREKLLCLRDGGWLNDDVIELYMRLIVKR